MERTTRRVGVLGTLAACVLTVVACTSSTSAINTDGPEEINAGTTGATVTTGTTAVTSVPEQSSSSLTPTPVAGEPIMVPSVVGESLRSATNTLINIGFDVEEQFSPDPSGEYEAGEVFRQEPEAGTMVEPFSLVTIFVADG